MYQSEEFNPSILKQVVTPKFIRIKGIKILHPNTFRFSNLKLCLGVSSPKIPECTGKQISNSLGKARERPYHWVLPLSCFSVLAWGMVQQVSLLSRAFRAGFLVCLILEQRFVVGRFLRASRAYDIKRFSFFFSFT